MLLFFEKSHPKKSSGVEVISTTPKALSEDPKSVNVRQQSWAAVDAAPWLVRTSKEGVELVATMLKVVTELAEFCTANQGLRTGDNQKYLSDTKGADTWKPAAGGKQIGRYAPIPHGLFVCYKPALLDAPRRTEIFTSREKLVVQEIRKHRACASHRRNARYCADSCLQSTNVMNKRPGVDVDMRYLLGVLNSRAVNYFFRFRFSGNDHIPSNQLLQIPIPVPASQLVNNIVRLVDTMLSLNRHLACVKSGAQKATIERQIDATDAAIDRLVYELYGLTAEKIALIEISTSKSLLKKAAQRADEGGELDLEVPA